MTALPREFHTDRDETTQTATIDDDNKNTIRSKPKTKIDNEDVLAHVLASGFPEEDGGSGEGRMMRCVGSSSREGGGR